VKHKLSLDLPAAHRGVRVARNVVRHFARLQGMKDHAVESLTLVVSELLANAIDHGGGNAALTEEDLESEVRVKLELVLNQVEWSVGVTDQGGGDPALVQKSIDGNEFPDLEDDRGRGIYLTRQMVDQMSVTRSPGGRGLTFRATKKHGG